MADRVGAPPPNFETVAPKERRVPVVGHVPHASTHIPAGFRAGMVLGDADLEREVLRLTDWLIDDLFAWLPGRSAPLFVNRLSRLVFDPERFASDDEEPMAGVGQSAVSTPRLPDKGGLSTAPSKGSIRSPPRQRRPRTRHCDEVGRHSPGGMASYERRRRRAVPDPASAPAAAARMRTTPIALATAARATITCASRLAGPGW